MNTNDTKDTKSQGNNLLHCGRKEDTNRKPVELQKRPRGRPRKTGVKRKHSAKEKLKKVEQEHDGDEIKLLDNPKLAKKVKQEYKTVKNKTRRILMQKAVDEVLAIGEFEGQAPSTVYKAAKNNGIPVNTLKYQVEKCKRNGGLVSSAHSSCAFPAEVEERLKEYILLKSEHGFPVTVNDVRNTALELAGALKLLNFKASSGWYSRFKKRCGIVFSTRIIQSVTLDRFRNSNRDLIDDWFSLLAKVFAKVKVLNKDIINNNGLANISPEVDAAHIYNCDETGYQLSGTRSLGLVRTGSKLAQRISQMNVNNTTCLGCVCADGTKLPGFYILAGKIWTNEGKEVKTSIQMEGGEVHLSENGWTNRELFFEWCSFFVRQINEKHGELEQRLYTILIMDGHDSHMADLKSLDFLRKNKIIALAMPSHTSHLLQPCDVGIFSSVKRYYKSLLDKFNEANRGRVSLKEYDVVRLSSQSWNFGVQCDAIKTSFKKCGIFPLNRQWVLDNVDKLQADKFKPVSKVDLVRYSKAKEQDWILDVNGHSYPKSDFACLFECEGVEAWLNDRVINCWGRLRCPQDNNTFVFIDSIVWEYHVKQSFSSSGRKRKLSKKHAMNLESWQNDVKASKFTFLPLYLQGNHWALLVYMQQTDGRFVLSIFDSMTQSLGESHQRHIDCFQSLFQTEEEKKNTCIKSQFSTVLQRDGHNCGVFVCYFVDKIIEHKKLDVQLPSRTFATGYRAEMLNKLCEKFGTLKRNEEENSTPTNHDKQGATTSDKVVHIHNTYNNYTTNNKNCIVVNSGKEEVLERYSHRALPDIEKILRVTNPTIKPTVTKKNSIGESTQSSKVANDVERCKKVAKKTMKDSTSVLLKQAMIDMGLTVSREPNRDHYLLFLSKKKPDMNLAGRKLADLKELAMIELFKEKVET